MRNKVAWGLSILLCLGFIGSGSMKLINSQVMVTQFQGFGYPMWFMHLTGVMEIVGAILAAFPRTAYLGAGVISVIMVGAIASHWSHGQFLMSGGAIFMLILAIALGSLRQWRPNGGTDSLEQSAAAN